MEEQRLDGQADYWLVQYQRLMDQKPQRLIDQVSLLYTSSDTKNDACKIMNTLLYISFSICFGCSKKTSQ